jgi:hypothetical protein
MQSNKFGSLFTVTALVTVMLSGCGGSQPPIGAPGVMPLNSKVVTESRTPNTGSGSGALIYVQNDKGTYILSYATGKIVGSFDLVGGANLCSDKDGHVFIPAKGAIYEYAHGGTTPIAQLSDEGNETLGCSVDPITGNLAVANYYTACHGVSCANGNIAVFTQARGKAEVLL